MSLKRSPLLNKQHSMQKKFSKDLPALIGFIALSEAAGIVGSFFTAPSIAGWYATLTKPDIAPPNWIFAPVWTTLFLLMGIAAFLVWRTRKNTRTALGLFGLQLALNVLWSLLFFGLQNPGAALAEITLLWLSIAATMVAFAKFSKPAAWLLVPYIAWVSFAGYLNFLLWSLNS
ncbi:TspO protein [Candidatus Adlerbacteria bacterium RIFOXYC1_FULL_48_26]|uniref:TspO protein n=1 Tax=Candidatus Adlerbacteria bacterium RIFOXYC1_FULL_48_26 TaxID=1797247 RepID=A0A1F4Y479_9BACT|nr:MAG: TspO protein [Candidatus Adlerbacteria bacterium RIFOXYC1_FULL_48_26]